MAYEIKKVAILGAGVMGSGIAAHFANAGIPSLLFDIVPKDAGADFASRTALALQGVEVVKKIKPAAFYRADDASLIEPLNYEDHADRLAEADLIIEGVVELIHIKHKVFEWVAANRRPGSIVASNTSGISLAALAEPMPEEMQQHFLITHFFNPVRYMRLLELVKGEATLPEVACALADFGEKKLGKGIIWGKDTPNFVANRIGIYGIGTIFKRMDEHGLGVKAIDSIFGPALGRARSAIFRTADIVGIDTLVHVFDNVYEGCPDDEEREVFVVPQYVRDMVDKGWLGQKSGQGFFKKAKAADGSRLILELDLATMEYREPVAERYGSIGKARKKDDMEGKLTALFKIDDVASRIAWDVLADISIYSANRVPEIADDIVQIDRGMCWGFGWADGPFETWDAMGVRSSVERMTAEGRTVPQWVLDMLAAGRESFYERDQNGDLTFWSHEGHAVVLETPADKILIPDLEAGNAEVKRNASATLYDIGHGVLLLEFHSKMNSIDNMIGDMYRLALDKLDEGEFEALVIGNQHPQAFSAGANVMMVLMAAMQKKWDDIEALVKDLQDLMMRAKYCERPVVTAPFGLTLGGGAELTMHSSATQASGELYMGLVEAGVGLIPAGGGCKEMLVRYLGDVPEGVAYDPNPFVQAIFKHIGLGEVAVSAEQARQWGFLRPTDRLTLDSERLIADAKKVALGLVAAGYKPPRRRTVKLPGSTGRGALEQFLYSMREGGFASDHDVLMGKKLGHVLCGGDVPWGTELTEQQLLDLEREAFVSLCGEKKTQERMQHMLQKGKVLRN